MSDSTPPAQDPARELDHPRHCSGRCEPDRAGEIVHVDTAPARIVPEVAPESPVAITLSRRDETVDGEQVVHEVDVALTVGEVEVPLTLAELEGLAWMAARAVARAGVVPTPAPAPATIPPPAPGDAPARCARGA